MRVLIWMFAPAANWAANGSEFLNDARHRFVTLLRFRLNYPSAANTHIAHTHPHSAGPCASLSFPSKANVWLHANNIENR